MSDSEYFERLVLGIPFRGDRLKKLQRKASDRGLRGDEVFELIHLDRKELVDELAAAKEREAELEQAWIEACSDAIAREKGLKTLDKKNAKLVAMLSEAKGILEASHDLLLFEDVSVESVGYLNEKVPELLKKLTLENYECVPIAMTGDYSMPDIHGPPLKEGIRKGIAVFPKEKSE